MSNKPKLLIIGYARHGKDTVAEILSSDYGYTYKASSEFCSEKLIFPVLSLKYGYKTVEECFEDRINHRAEWYDLISEYNTPDRAKLGKEIFKESDIYCGLRNYDEFMALRNQNVYDYCIWVDRTKYLPKEDISSNTLYSDLADIFIDNNGTLEDLKKEVFNLTFRLGMEFNKWELT